MQLEQEILKEHSKAQCDKIVCWVGDSQQRFDELIKLFFEGEYRVVQRAAWPMSYCVAEHPQLIRKHFKRLIKNLSKPGLHNAVKRNTLRLLQEIEIPEGLHGEVMDKCFGYILSYEEPVAVKAFALTVLGNLSQDYPGIIPEIRLVIEERMPHETAAFRSRAKKIWKKLKL